MKIFDFIKNETVGWGKLERVIFPLCLLIILSISIYMKDTPIAMISAVCGLSYTILAGKGKISCYYIGIMGTLCYAYLSLKAQLYGNLVLYLCYYLPMQTYGIFSWKKHLQKDSHSIKKTCLTNKEILIYLFLTIFLTVITFLILSKLGDKSPLIDAITTIFSIFGLLFTVKRCVEQWYIWFVVNGLSTIMWVQAVLNGVNAIATVLMWFGYFVLTIYFLINWKKEIKNYND